jgi:hypothetical protein
MPAHYCPLHARLFRARKHEWMDFPREKIEAIKSLYQFFQRRDIATPEYRVVEMTCDQCAVQKFQEKPQNIDPP